MTFCALFLIVAAPISLSEAMLKQFVFHVLCKAVFGDKVTKQLH